MEIYIKKWDYILKLVKIDGCSNFSAFQIFNRLLLLNFNVCFLTYVKFIAAIIEYQVPAFVKFLIVNIVYVRARMSSLSSCQVSSSVKFFAAVKFFFEIPAPKFSQLTSFPALTKFDRRPRCAQCIVMSSRTWYGENLTHIVKKLTIMR